MEEDIKILEDMRDKIYGEIQFVDDFDIEIECQKQFDALNLAINHLRKNKIDKNNFIPKSKIKEKIEELESKIKATFCKYMTEEDYYNNKFLSSDVVEDYEVLEVRKLISNRNLLQELMEDK